MVRVTTMRSKWSGVALALCGAALWQPGAPAADEAKPADAVPAADVAEREMAQALALDPNVPNGLTIYRVCADCHQPEGWGLPDGSYPQIAGQHKKVIVKQLADIRAGVRESSEMYPHVSSWRISDAQGVADVAGYIDTLEISVKNGKGPGDDLARGESLYSEACASCHGESGEGDGERVIPRIQAQHYAYLLRQFLAIRDSRRGNADPEMVDHVGAISDAEASAMLDYVSRLEPAEPFQAPPGWRNPDFPH